MRYYLGLDGGGTKTAAVILDEDGAKRGHGTGGPGNIATGDDATLASSVRDAVSGALAAAGIPPETRFAGVCAGVAGYTAKGRRADFAHLLADLVPADRHRIEPDFVIAWWGATGGEPGIAVIAGTGAVTYGRNAAGRSCRVDGRGFLIGDRGSGFDIGRLALKWTMTRLDAGKMPDAMSQRLLSHIGAEDADDLIEWVYRDFQPARIAELAGVAGALAAKGDETAVSLLQNAGYMLRSAASKVIRRLEMPDDTPVYPLGGLWNTGEMLRRAFAEGNPYWRRPLPVLNLREARHDAAHGAALLAMREED